MYNTEDLIKLLKGSKIYTTLHKNKFNNIN